MQKKRFSFLSYAGIILKERIRESLRLFKPVVTDPEFSAADRAYLSVSVLIRLSLFSLLCFSLSYLLVVIFHNTLQGIFLFFNGIHFKFSLFQIVYLPGDVKIWSEGALLLTYTLPYFIILLAGIFIGEKISRPKNITWQTRLLLNWISLNLIVFFISNLLKAIFFYRDFGVALHWVLESIYLRMAVVFIISVLLVWYCKRFHYNFLKTAPGKVFLLSASLKRTWLLYILVLPVFPGIICPGLIWWPAMRLNMLLTFVVFMIIYSLIMVSVGYLQDSRIYKSKKTVPSMVFTISALSILWVIFKLLAGYSFAFN